MSGRSVSITGATGFVGSHLAEAMRDAGWRVRAIVRPDSPKPVPKGVELVRSALDVASLTRAAAYSEVLVHAAGVIRAPHASAFEGVNVGGTQAAVDAANAVGARVILISSLAAAGAGTPARPAREENEPQPLTAYGRSKLAAELVVRSSARVPWTIVRPSAVYGPRDRGFLPLFRFASRGWFPLVAGPATAFTLIHVEDLARGIVLAAADERAAGETLFFGHGRPQTTDEVLHGLARALGRRYRPWRVPSPVMSAAAYAGEVLWLIGRQPMVDTTRLREFGAGGFVCSVDRAQEVLGFRATTDWPEGAERTAQWYRERGWI